MPPKHLVQPLPAGLDLRRPVATGKALMEPDLFQFPPGAVARGRLFDALGDIRVNRDVEGKAVRSRRVAAGKHTGSRDGCQDARPRPGHYGRWRTGAGDIKLFRRDALLHDPARFLAQPQIP